MNQSIRKLKNAYYVFKRVKIIDESIDELSFQCLKCGSYSTIHKNYRIMHIVCKCGHRTKINTGRTYIKNLVKQIITYSLLLRSLLMSLYQVREKLFQINKKLKQNIKAEAGVNEDIKLTDKNVPKDGLLCLQPFTTMTFQAGGVVSCCCLGWTKFGIGNIKDKNIDEMWNSNALQFIRKNIYNFEWQNICNEACPHVSYFTSNNKYVKFSELEKNESLSPEIINDIKKRETVVSSTPAIYNFSNSNVCNLNCLMCTKDSIADDQTVIFKTIEDVTNHIQSAKRIILSGNGDPFARPDTMKLLTDPSWQNVILKFDLITNALLLPRYWDKVKHNNFGSLLISMDGATKETYERIRIGGKWEKILESLNLVKENIRRFESVTINMTVMKSNYKEIPKFIELAKYFGFYVSFQRVRGSFGNENIFELKDEKCIGELTDIVESYKNQNHSDIFWGDLISLMKV